MRLGLKALRLLAWASLAVAAAVSAAVQAPVIEALSSPVTVRLRGLSAVSDRIAWASGPEGTVLRTTDAGKSWSVFKVPGAEKLDFRDVEGFSADEAVVLSIGPGEDSRVYRTRDGGKTWTLSFRNRDPRAFFDCFDFDGERGWMLGDPVDGRFQVFETADRGVSWHLRPDGPKAVEGEAAFAASGTCIRREDRMTVFVTGGSVARVHYLPDGMKRKPFWRIAKGVIATKLASAGLFSVAGADGRLLVVGGDYEKPALPGLSLRFSPMLQAISTNYAWQGPAYWRTTREGYEYQPEGRRDTSDGSSLTGPSDNGNSLPGYRSGVACASKRDFCVATGPGGSDVLLSDDTTDIPLYGVSESEHGTGDTNADGSSGLAFALWGTAKWMFLSESGYDSVDFAGHTFWFSGDGGRLGRMVILE